MARPIIHNVETAEQRYARLAQTRRSYVHKTCPTWGETQCGLERFNTQNHKVTERWRDVTCPKCLRLGGRSL
jgi:hypothetical protein